MRRSTLILGLWLAGILFPLVGMRHFSTTYRGIIDALFGMEWVHVVMHVILFAGLSILLMLVFQANLSWRTVLIILGAVLLTGIAQEFLQWISQGISPWRPESLLASGYDLCVDLSAALLGLGLIWLVQARLVVSNKNLANKH
jgi:hypothetical protein